MAYNTIQTMYKRLGLSDTYSEELNVVQDLVVEGEVIAGNDIDSGLFLYLPVLQAQSFALAQQVVEWYLASPIVFSCFFEISINSHARETEDCAEEAVSTVKQGI
jgi:hypothetical protein